MTGYIKLETIGKMGDMISYLEQQNELLQKKLEIATKALKEYAELETIGEEARQALKEMEEV